MRNRKMIDSWLKEAVFQNTWQEGFSSVSQSICKDFSTKSQFDLADWRLFSTPITWQGGWSSAGSQRPSGLLLQRLRAGGGGGGLRGGRRRPSSGCSGSSSSQVPLRSSRLSPAPASYWIPSQVKALLVEYAASPPKVDEASLPKLGQVGAIVGQT